MDTFKKIRKECITILTREVINSADMAYITVELQKRKENILVVMNHSDEIVKTVLNEMDPEDSGYIFFASELLLDPLNNCMVPTHRIATSEEIDKLLYNKIPLEKLPILKMTDPIRRWHNFPRGSIIAIERNEPQSELVKTNAIDEDIFFRRVV